MSDTSGSFSEFAKVCLKLGQTTAHTEKTAIVARYLKSFKGDAYLFCKLILPKEDQRVYNLKAKQICKVLSSLLGCQNDDMVADLSKGEVSDTCARFFEHYGKTQATSTLTLAEVDTFLNELTGFTRSADQEAFFRRLLKRCTSDDLRFFIRLVVHDLRHYTGAKFVLFALHPQAYDIWTHNNNLKQVVDGYVNGNLDSLAKAAGGGHSHVVLSAMKPMLARPCKSLDEAIRRCPNGMLSEIKYDGERIQIHKDGSDFKFYSRNLKVMPEKKIAEVRNWIPKAIPSATSLIVDGEILLMSKDGEPLPFGTLGVHKKKAFTDATVCVIIFDIMHLSGKSLMKTPLRERRATLKDVVKEIPGRVQLSEGLFVEDPEDLTDQMNTVLSKKLEGLVMKDLGGVYEPAARHWLKIKKDYLEGMADSADLIVLGAYYGTGSKGNMMSIFLMGVHDPVTDTFKTVCKCGNGHDDAQLARLQTELEMVPTHKDKSKVPSWLDVSSSYVPDFVSRDPRKAQVWEVVGAEFSESNFHTADKISIRFPRVTRIRKDKDFNTATNLPHLRTLVKSSNQTSDVRVPKAASPVKKKGVKRSPNTAATTESPARKKARKSPTAQPTLFDTFAAQGKKKGADKAERTTKDNASDDSDDIQMVDRKAITVEPHQGNMLNPHAGSKDKKDHAAIVLHFVDDSGRWFNRGVGRELAKHVPNARDVYESADVSLGSIHKIEVYPDIVLYLVVAFDSETRPPQIKQEFLPTAFRKLNTIAQDRGASVHVHTEMVSKIGSDIWAKLRASGVSVCSHKHLEAVAPGGADSSSGAAIDLACSSSEDRDKGKGQGKGMPILPDLFDGIYVIDKTTVANIKDLTRYVAAFGGDPVIIDDQSSSEVTGAGHIVSDNWEGQVPAGCKVISSSAVWAQMKGGK